MRCRLILLSFFFLFQLGFAQKKVSRIKKEAFPEKAYTSISAYVEDAKRIRFYEKNEGGTKNYEATFKKGRLHYSVGFNATGDLIVVAFGIMEYDVPEESWNTITSHLNAHYDRLRIKKILQQHPNVEKDTQKTLHDAFQNLMLPYINYNIIFTAKTEDGGSSHEAVFDAEGNPMGIPE